jgi:hypothetical protein
LSKNKRKPTKKSNDSKPFDSTLKALFGKQAEEAIACLLPDARLQGGLPDDELNVEINRNTLSIDLGYGILYKREFSTLNLEAQSGPDDDLLPRMLEYAINLYRKYKRRPVVSVGLFLFKCEVPKIPFVIDCGGDRFVEFHPIIICMWEMDPQKVVERQQRCLYPLLPTMKGPTVDLLKQALQEMHEHDEDSEFANHVEWFETMLSRTTTVSEKDKKLIEEHLRMQYQLHPLLAQNPTIQNVIAEETAKRVAKELAEAEAKIEAKSEARGETRGIIKGLQEGIIDLINDRFSAPVVKRAKQAIAPSQDIQQLKKLIPQIARAADEEEVYALLNQYFPVQDEKTKGEIKGIQMSILDIVSARFSPQVQAQIQQAIAPIQDVAQLRKFLRQLACLSDEQEVSALVEQCFPIQRGCK